LVRVHDHSDMTLFVHQWLSTLKSFFEVWVYWLFPHNVRNPIVLIPFVLNVWSRWIVAINSVKRPLCVIFDWLWRHLILLDQFLCRILVFGILLI
jgi:hypothetical protein